MTQIKAPFQYFGDPSKSRSLFNARLYFGLPDEDPEDDENQKLVKAIQEDGTEVSLSQPISTNSGGYPTYNGSPVRLSIAGDYSFKAFNARGVQVFDASRIENAEEGSEGFSGVVIRDVVELSAPGQTTVMFPTAGANESVFYLHSTIGDQKWLAVGLDYNVVNPTTIELTKSYNVGDKIVARQNDPTGQLVEVIPTAKSVLIFPSISDAQAAASDLSDYSYVGVEYSSIPTDDIGGARYVVIPNTYANDNLNYFDLDGSRQLKLLSSYQNFSAFSEKVVTTTIIGGVITIDVSKGTIFKVNLTENVSDILFINKNTASDRSNTINLILTQDATGGRSVAWPGTTSWDSGVGPAVTATADRYDIFTFSDFGHATKWQGFRSGENRI